ncbi:histidine kinase N-terminal 7TM domain-containing protein [Halapricum desulfuricans]|uniref:Signal transduction histidine kinase, contains PAS domain n=1 Tax=Halapricum desulfuricans TaxID=2841257 RepID=A0A897N608_9EURY|nr:histidine kinase N-terminal 7TM domain-containing protein [Halapricum desulfuricans]QSG06445.1 Signal transduction histidine kinase, contains PAS domain [Halapricum desulfuricans]
MTALSSLVYIVAFAFTSLACFASILRAREIEDRDTRIGMIGLLAGSGAWAGSHTAVLLVPGFQLKNVAYLIGLVFGFSTVWAWLYFASAYTGRTYHRDPTFRRAGIATYLAVVAVKLTNPIHHAYYEATLVDDGFTHLVIQQGVFHWTVTGLSYALASIGLFMLFEQFAESDHDTRIVAALASLTAVPVVLDIAAYSIPELVNIIHAPFGVAAFALGTLFLYQEQFLAVHFSADVDDAVVFLDADDRIRDFNDAAARIVPGLADARGEPVEHVEPLADALGTERTVLDFRIDAETRHFLVTESDFSLGQTGDGRMLVLTDVSRIERQRRELKRHNDQLEDLAVGIRHELRNTLQIVAGNVEAAQQYVERDPETASRALSTAATTSQRMREIVDDLSMLAEYSQSVEETHPVRLREAAKAARQRADLDGLELRLESDDALEADERRFEELLHRAFVFADAIDSSSVTVSLADGELVLEADGDRPTGTSAETFFEFEESVPTAEAGMALPSFRALARAHGWEPVFDADYDDGVRIVVEGVVTCPQTAVAAGN